jgi:hypothetical protein
MLLVKESVRWLAKKGRNEEALENLIWIRGGDTPEVRAEFEEILAGLEEEVRATEGVTWKELLLPANRFRVFVIISMQLGVQLTGNTSLAYYAPQIFKSVGAGNSSLLVTGFFGVVKVSAVSIFSFFIVSRIGRKTAFMGGAAAMGCFMLAIAIIVAKEPPSTTGGVSHAGIAAIAMVYCEASAYNMSWGPVSWLYLGEIFPTRIREFGIAIGAASQWLFNFMLSEITPHAINNIHWRMFLMFSIFNYSLVVYAFFVLREVCLSYPNVKIGYGQLIGNASDIGQVPRRDGGSFWIGANCSGLRGHSSKSRAVPSRTHGRKVLRQLYIRMFGHKRVCSWFESNTGWNFAFSNGGKTYVARFCYLHSTIFNLDSNLGLSRLVSHTVQLHWLHAKKSHGIDVCINVLGM